MKNPWANLTRLRRRHCSGFGRKEWSMDRAAEVGKIACKREFAPVRKRSRPRGENAWSRQTWRYNRLDGGRDGQQAAVGAVLPDQHEADRCIAGAVTRDRDRAAVEEVRDPWVAQHQKVSVTIAVVRGEIGNARRGHGDGGHDQGVVVRRDSGNATDEISPRSNVVDVIGGILFLP